MYISQAALDELAVQRILSFVNVPSGCLPHLCLYTYAHTYTHTYIVYMPISVTIPVPIPLQRVWAGFLGESCLVTTMLEPL